ncbi:hypothetical protein PIB30_061572 [Stylosanthes scabra]|uniref:DUF4283 domain-containing protein n=1 Tax=Stylosanthes scabra TaxID=79078 RepID=A0ABU6XIP7_9FABA|nr:hypothetical protein [Stylosanthes scabra]
MAAPAAEPLVDLSVLVPMKLHSMSFGDSQMRWNGNLEIKETEFINVPLWIQLWGVPEHCKTKSLAVKVGSSLGKVLDADLFQMRNGDERFLKVKVLLNVTMPLRRTLKIAEEGNSQVRNIASENQDKNEMEGGDKEGGADSQEVLQIKEKAITNLQIPFSAETSKCNFVVGSSGVRLEGRGKKRQSLKCLAKKGSSIHPVTGIKRISEENIDDISSKKQYRIDNSPSEKGEGATQQLAPQGL